MLTDRKLTDDEVELTAFAVSSAFGDVMEAMRQAGLPPEAIVATYRHLPAVLQKLFMLAAETKAETCDCPKCAAKRETASPIH